MRYLKNFHGACSMQWGEINTSNLLFLQQSNISLFSLMFSDISFFSQIFTLLLYAVPCIAVGSVKFVLESHIVMYDILLEG